MSKGKQICASKRHCLHEGKPKSGRTGVYVFFIRLISILFLMVFLRENVLHDIDTNINPMRQSDMGIIIFDLIESKATQKYTRLRIESMLTCFLSHLVSVSKSTRKCNCLHVTRGFITASYHFPHSYLFYNCGIFPPTSPFH